MKRIMYLTMFLSAGAGALLASYVPVISGCTCSFLTKLLSCQHFLL